MKKISRFVVACLICTPVYSEKLQIKIRTDKSFWGALGDLSYNTIQRDDFRPKLRLKVTYEKHRRGKRNKIEKEEVIVPIPSVGREVAVNKIIKRGVHDIKSLEVDYTYGYPMRGRVPNGEDIRRGVGGWYSCKPTQLSGRIKTLKIKLKDSKIKAPRNIKKFNNMCKLIVEE